MSDDTPAPPPRYLWFDMEFTDLDPDRAHILQIAALATDVQLTPLIPDDTGLDITVRLPADTPVSDWVRENLSDLLHACRSETAVPLTEAGTCLEAYLRETTGECPSDIAERPVLAGNSVHNDWRLAAQHFPQVVQRLHYRLLDISTLKQQWLGWLGQSEFDKENAALVSQYLPFPATLEGRQLHDARYDILASIAELNFYRKHMLHGIVSD